MEDPKTIFSKWHEKLAPYHISEEYLPDEFNEVVSGLLEKYFSVSYYSVFVESSMLHIKDEFYSEKHPFLLSNIRRFKEGGIPDWVKTLGKPAVLPDWEASDYNSSYVLFGFEPNKDTSLLFVGRVSKSRDEVEKELLDAIGFYLRDYLNYFAHKLVMKENESLRNRMKFINGKVLDQSKYATFGEIAEYGLQGVRGTLSAIDAHLKFIESGLGDPATRVTVIRKEFDKVVDELKQLISIYADSYSHREALVDVNEISNSFADFIKKYLTLRDINFVREIEEGLPSVKANHSTLYYVFFNIAGNAARAMPESGEFTFSVFEENNVIHFNFADTGVGMNDEELARVFIPFVSGPNRPNNMGISLYISKNLIERIGGTIKLASQEGIGTTVKVLLPVQNEEAE
jgi:hypothetical protein